MRETGRIGGAVCVFVATQLGGCALPKHRPAERAWTEVRSRHFVVQSDLAASEAEELTLDFERSYAALRSCVYAGGDDPSGTTEVVAIADEADYRAVAPPRMGAFYHRRFSVIEATSRVVLPVTFRSSRQRLGETIQHELTHRFVAHYFTNVPLWLNEGMAEFLSTARIEGDSVVLGDPPEYHWYSPSGWMLGHTQLVNVVPDPAVLRNHTTGQLYASEYAGAWLLVHVLVLGKPAYRRALEGYLEELRTSRLSANEAFDAHFDAALLEDIDAAYMAFQKRTETPTQSVSMRVQPELSVRSRTLPRAEAHALWGRLRASDPPNRMLALEDANLATRSDPKSPEGNLLRGMLRLEAKDEAGAIAELRAARALAPKDARVRRALAAVLLSAKGPDDEVDTLARQVADEPRAAEDFLFLATWEMAERRPLRALERAAQAARQNVNCVRCYETAAMAAARGGDSASAVEWQKRAINVAADDADPNYLERLKLFEEKQAAFAARHGEGQSPRPATPSSEPGRLDPSVIQDTMRQSYPSFHKCYGEGLGRNRELRGRVILRFVVDAEGAVSQATDGGSELKDDAVMACMLGVTRSLKFEKPEGGIVTVAYPIVFEPD